MVSFSLIRFIIFVICWIFGYEFWILPNLFDESLSFQDSFKPLLELESSAPGQGLYRIGLIFGMYLCIYVSMCLCIYVSVSMYLCVYVSMCLCISLSMNLCIYMSMYLSIYASMCLYIYVSMYLCIYLFI
jgi:hypothetical protein